MNKNTTSFLRVAFPRFSSFFYALAVFGFFSENTQSQTWLINFNTSTGYRGASQTNTDANGNIWNNMNPGFWANLTTATGTNTGS
ncbi:hypothetical protein EBX31_10930, partial [bacterium]|nr:hypothetical protein [bacterium]